MSTYKIKTPVVAQSIRVGTILMTASPGTLATGIFTGLVAGCVPAIAALAPIDLTASIAIPGLKTGGTVIVQFAQQTVTAGNDASGLSVIAACAGNGGASLTIMKRGSGGANASTMLFSFLAANP
jgi:hypothetical protein